MPCNSDYLEPTTREKELRRAARLLQYVLETLDKPVPTWVRQQASEIYANDPHSVTQLCAELTVLDDAQREALLYGDARNRTARDLASWWERHQEADRIRERQDAREQLRQDALAKLTPEDRRILDL